MITPLPNAWPQKPGSATLPFFGVVPVLLDEKGTEVKGEGEGYLCIKQARCVTAWAGGRVDGRWGSCVVGGCAAWRRTGRAPATAVCCRAAATAAPTRTHTHTHRRGRPRCAPCMATTSATRQTTSSRSRGTTSPAMARAATRTGARIVREPASAPTARVSPRTSCTPTNAHQNHAMHTRARMCTRAGTSGSLGVLTT
jgi:hypothetical protein